MKIESYKTGYSEGFKAGAETSKRLVEEYLLLTVSLIEADVFDEEKTLPKAKEIADYLQKIK